MRRRQAETIISSGHKVRMEVRQVAMGAAIGAAVAVNAALQSLQDAGSFLIQGPSYVSSPALPDLFANGESHCALLRSSTEFDGDDGSLFREFLEEEGEEFNKEHTPFTARVPTVDCSEALADFESKGWTGQCGLKKLPVKRKHVECTVEDVARADCYLKDTDEEISSTEDGDGEWLNSSTSMIQMARPLLPQHAHSEELMSAVLQHTTKTVLETLSAAKERREQMLEEIRRSDLPKEQITLQLVNRFIDALINVTDSLRTVHLALFSKPDDLQGRQ